MKILKMSLIGLLIFILISNIALADGFSLLTPRFVVRMNTTNYTGQIGVANFYSIPADVQMTASSNIADFVKLSDSNFTLVSNETRWVNFTLNIVHPGNYSGEILSSFKLENMNAGLSLATDVIIFSNIPEFSEEPTAPANPTPTVTVVAPTGFFLGLSTTEWVIGIIIGIMLTIVIVYFFKIKKKKV